MGEVFVSIAQRISGAKVVLLRGVAQARGHGPLCKKRPRAKPSGCAPLGRNPYPAEEAIERQGLDRIFRGCIIDTEIWLVVTEEIGTFSSLGHTQGVLVSSVTTHNRKLHKGNKPPHGER